MADGLDTAARQLAREPHELQADQMLRGTLIS